MKSIFDEQTIIEFKERINQLDATAPAQWGTNNVYQMLMHCIGNEEMTLREKPLPRVFMGRIFGKMALNANIKDETPLKKNLPTHKLLKFNGNGAINQLKNDWITMLEKYPSKTESDFEGFIHPFFGSMNATQISRYAVKHIDHHLRQFDV